MNINPLSCITPPPLFVPAFMSKGGNLACVIRRLQSGSNATCNPCYSRLNRRLNITEAKWQDLLSHCLSICPHFLPSNYHPPDVRLMMCIRDVLLSHRSPFNSAALTSDGRKWLPPEQRLTDAESSCTTRHTAVVSEWKMGLTLLHSVSAGMKPIPGAWQKKTSVS